VEHLSCFDSLVRPVKINWQHDLSSNKTKPVLYCTQYFTGVLTLIGSCVLKASVSWVSADMLTDTQLTHRPILGRYVHWHSADILTNIDRHTCQPTLGQYFTDTQLTLGRYFTDTQPTLRSFGGLLLLTSIFLTQISNNLLYPFEMVFRWPSSVFDFSYWQHSPISDCFFQLCLSRPQVALDMYSSFAFPVGKEMAAISAKWLTIHR